MAYGASIEDPAEMSLTDDADGAWDNGVCEFCEGPLNEHDDCESCTCAGRGEP